MTNLYFTFWVNGYDNLWCIYLNTSFDDHQEKSLNLGENNNGN